MFVYIHTQSFTYTRAICMYISCGRTGAYEDSIVQDPTKSCAGVRYLMEQVQTDILE